MTTTRYFNPISGASPDQALQPDVSADVTPRNLHRAGACGAELKRLLLIERPHIRNRRAWLTIEVLVAVADRVIFAIEQLGESI